MNKSLISAQVTATEQMKQDTQVLYVWDNGEFIVTTKEHGLTAYPNEDWDDIAEESVLEYSDDPVYGSKVVEFINNLKNN